MQENPKELAFYIADVLDNRKAMDIAILDIHGMTVIADYFVICSGRSISQVQALYDEVEKKTAEAGFSLIRVEGQREGRWIVMDYGSVIVHIFHKEERSFYNLERLWMDGQGQSVFNYQSPHTPVITNT